MILFSLLGLAFANGSEPVVPAETALQGTLTVKVGDRDVAATDLIGFVEANGGYFSELAAHHVVLRMPTASFEDVVDHVESLGLVVERSRQSASLAEELATLRRRLESRNAVLEQYFQLLSGANPKAVVSVEREITQLVAEIEGIQGVIREREHRSNNARLMVSWQFRDRRSPVAGDASFAWINQLNLATVVQQFQGGNKFARGKRNPVSLPVPRGFKAYKFKKETRAASPDGVAWRVRTVKQKPNANAEYWQEAVSKHLGQTGYTILDTQEVSVQGHPGFRLDLAAPYGEQDYRYVLVVVPSGNRVTLVEAVGEATRVAEHLGAISDGLK